MSINKQNYRQIILQSLSQRQEKQQRNGQNEKICLKSRDLTLCMIFYIVLAINVAIKEVFKPANSKRSFTKLLKSQEKLVKYQWQPENKIL